MANRRTGQGAALVPDILWHRLGTPNSVVALARDTPAFYSAFCRPCSLGSLSVGRWWPAPQIRRTAIRPQLTVKRATRPWVQALGFGPVRFCVVAVAQASKPPPKFCWLPPSSLHCSSLALPCTLRRRLILPVAALLVLPCGASASRLGKPLEKMDFLLVYCFCGCMAFGFGARTWATANAAEAKAEGPAHCAVAAWCLVSCSSVGGLILVWLHNLGILFNPLRVCPYWLTVGLCCAWRWLSTCWPKGSVPWRRCPDGPGFCHARWSRIFAWSRPGDQLRTVSILSVFSTSRVQQRINLERSDNAEAWRDTCQQRRFSKVETSPEGFGFSSSLAVASHERLHISVFSRRTKCLFCGRSRIS